MPAFLLISFSNFLLSCSLAFPSNPFVAEFTRRRRVALSLLSGRVNGHAPMIPSMAVHALPAVDDYVSDGAETPDRRWLLIRDIPCLACKYNLRGLVGPIVLCPECGHGNDLRRPDQWQTKELPRGVRQRPHWPATAVLISMAILGV